MRSPMTQEERYIKMTETPISRLIPSLAIPTIISMLVTSIYNMADTFFVSRISTSASAAVGVSYSLMAMIQALGFTLGMGSGNYLSRVLGSRDEEKAERIASTGFYTAIFVGLVFAAVCLPNLDLLVRLLGATDTIAPYAKDYAKYILMAAPVMTGALSMNNLLRFQGLAVYRSTGIFQDQHDDCGDRSGDEYCSGSDLYFWPESWNLRCGTGNGAQPVHQLWNPVLPEPFEKGLCPSQTGEDHLVSFTLWRDPPWRNPVTLSSRRCEHCNRSVKCSGESVRRCSDRSTFHCEPLYDVHWFGHDRLRTGLSAGVRIQFRCETV